MHDAHRLSRNPRDSLCCAVAAALILTATIACKSKTDSPPEPVADPVYDAKAAPSQEPPSDAVPPTTAPKNAREWTFENEARGGVPSGFTVAKGEWSLASDNDSSDSGTVLAQLGSSGRPEYNLILVDDTSYRDLDLSVRLKAQVGDIDQGGGVVWRAADAQNYYIARYNPLEDNFRVYRVESGLRKQIETADVKVDHDSWHTLRITHVGDRIECYLDGTRHLEATDTTFTEAGRIGLWTKADAQTHFDDLTVMVAGSASPVGADGAP